MNEEANTIIDSLGGTGAVAKMCEVTTGAVSQWRNNGLPKTQRKFLMAIRPDVFRAFETRGKAESAA